MRYFIKLFVFVVVFSWATTGMGDTSPTEASLDTFKIQITGRLKESPRKPLPDMDIDKIVKDVMRKGKDRIKYLEKNYPKEIVNVLKPALKSFHHLGKYKDEKGKTYFTFGQKKVGWRYYPDDMFKYGKILHPILSYNVISKKLDYYWVPLAFNDSVVAFEGFLAESMKSGSAWYGQYKPVDSFLAVFDSLTADSMVRISLSTDEKIISKKLFMLPQVVWGFLVERTDENGKNPDTTVYLYVAQLKKTYNINTINDWEFINLYAKSDKDSSKEERRVKVRKWREQ